MKEVRYYKDFSEDFEKSENQDIKLSDDYEYIREDFLSKLKSKLIYSAVAVLGFFHSRFVLHVRYVNRKALKAAKDRGCFIFANHTQPFGDVYLPALAALPKRIYTVVSPANFGIPVIGRLLPYLGALPLAKSPKGMKKFTEAMGKRIEEKKAITIYPEAHVWEYYAEVRPYSEASFRYPAKFSAPSFAMTVTYRKHKLLKKPKTTVYIDGPFYPDRDLHIREQSKKLHKEIYETMKKRAENSTYSYIEYIKKN